MTVKHPNGYCGVLQNGVLTISKDGVEVLSLKRDYTTEIEIYRQLEVVPNIMEMMRVVSE